MHDDLDLPLIAGMTITADRLAAWLRHEDPTTTYNYLNNHDCLIARFLRANGFPTPYVGGSHWFSTQEDYAAANDAYIEAVRSNCDGFRFSATRGYGELSDSAARAAHAGRYDRALEMLTSTEQE